MADGKVSIEISAEAKSAQKNLTALSSEFQKTAKDVEEAAKALADFKKQSEKAFFNGKSRDEYVSGIEDMTKRLSEAQSKGKFKLASELQSGIAERQAKLREFDSAVKSKEEVDLQSKLIEAAKKRQDIETQIASEKEKLAKAQQAEAEKEAKIREKVREREYKKQIEADEKEKIHQEKVEAEAIKSREREEAMAQAIEKAREEYEKQTAEYEKQRAEEHKRYVKSAKEAEELRKRNRTPEEAAAEEAQKAKNKKLEEFFAYHEPEKEPEKVKEKPKSFSQLEKEAEAEAIAKIREEAARTNPILSELTDRLAELKSKQKLMEKAGVTDGFEAYEKLKVDIEAVEAEIEQLINKETDAKISSEEVATALKKVASVPFILLYRGVVKVADALKSGIVSAANAAGSALKKVLSLPIYALKGTITGMIAPFKALSKSVKSFGQRLKTAVLQGLIFRQVRTILSKAVQELGKMMMTNTELAASLSSLKGTFITAFQPLLNFVAPVLVKIISLVQTAIAWISALLSLFGGLAKASNSSAEAMYNQAKATEAGGGAADKFLASWDTIQKVGNSGGGGGSSANAPTFDFDLDSVDISFAEKIKELIDNDHWFIVGQEIENKIEEALGTIDDLVLKLSPKLTTFATNVADLLNGALAESLKPDSLTLGTVVADFFNSVIDAFNTFLTTFSWDWLGQSIGKNINDFFTTFDFATAGITFTNLVSGVLTTIASTFRTADAELIGSSIGTALANIDFARLTVDFIDFALNAVDFLIQAIVSCFDPNKGVDVARILDALIKALTSADNWRRWSYLAGHILGSIVRAIINVVKLSNQLDLAAQELIINFGKAIMTGDWSKLEESVMALAEGFGEGFIDGVNGKKSEVQTAAGDMADSAVGATQDEFGFSHGSGSWDSSSVPYQTGENVAMALAAGISDNAESTKYEAELLGNSVVSGIDGVLGEEGTAQPVFVATGSMIPQCIADGIWSNMDPLKQALNGMIYYVELACQYINEGFAKVLSNAAAVKSQTKSDVQFGTIGSINLQRLAQGGVVNPGHEFAAILGDNRYEKEVVSPLSTMKQAFMEALADSGYNRGAGNITLQIDGTTFARITNPYLARENTRIGTKAMGGLTYG